MEAGGWHRCAARDKRPPLPEECRVALDRMVIGVVAEAALQVRRAQGSGAVVSTSSMGG